MDKRKMQASLSTKCLDATSIYNSLSKVEFSRADSGNSLTWADNDHITNFMNQALEEDKLAYYIAPISFGLYEKQYIIDSLTHICKRQTQDGSIINDHRGDELDKPFVFIANTTTVLSSKSNDVNKVGGVHWISWVLLPKKYKNVAGEVIENDKYRVYFFDSLGKENIPEELKRGLIEGLGGDNCLRLFPLCPKDEIAFFDNKELMVKQINASDCGWWACYCALMTVYNGDVKFLEKLQKRELSGKPLRSIMDLQETIVYEKETRGRKDSFYENKLSVVSLSSEPNLLNCMTTFSVRFVTVFEKHFLEFAKNLLDRNYKQGKYAAMFSGGISSLPTSDLLGVSKDFLPPLTSPLKWVANSISNFLKKRKIKSLTGKIHEFCSKQEDARIMFIKVAMYIFMAYEEQFAQEISLSNKNRLYNSIYDLADDVVNRIINYFTVHTEGEFTIQEMLKGVIDGDSKRYRAGVTGIPNFAAGHKTFIDTVQFISSPGIKHGKDYYQLELDNLVGEFLPWGFRTLFPFEMDRCEVHDETLRFPEFPPLVYKKVEVSEESKYNYTITEEMCSKTIPLVQSVLENAYWQITGDLKGLAKDILEVCERGFDSFSHSFDQLQRGILAVDRSSQHARDKEDLNVHEEPQIFPTNLFFLGKPTASFFNKMSSTNIVSPKEKLHFFARALLSSFLFYADNLVLRGRLAPLSSNTPHQDAQGLSASRIKEVNNFSRLVQSVPSGDLKKFLLSSGVILFQGFERPFQSITECQSSAKVITALSFCAAFRMVYYISKNFNVQHLSYDLMMEAALSGGCYEGLSPILFCVENGDSSVNADEIYDKTPVFVSEEEIFSYSENFIIKHGTRLAFDFEKKESQSFSQNRKTFMVDVSNFSQQQPYKYVLQNIDVVTECNLIIEEMLCDEGAQKSDISSVMQSIHTKTDTILACMRDAFPGIDGRGGPGGGPGGPGDDGSGGSGGRPRGPGGGPGGPGDDDSGGSGNEDLTTLYQNLQITTGSTECSGGSSSGTGGGSGGPGGGRRGRRPEDEDGVIAAISEKVSNLLVAKKENLQPVWFGVQNPVVLFTGRKRELEDLHSKMQDSSETVSPIQKIISITGLGGVGKTQLVRKYAQQYARDYGENVIWIDAGSRAELRRSFLALAKDNRLKISPSYEDGKQKSEEVIAREVYRFFADKKSLFIFDNVISTEDVKEFLPLNVLSPSDNTPYVLITSRNREWGEEIWSLKIGPLIRHEAVEFVKKGLKIKDNDQREEVEPLLEYLQYFPLAIQQAISYILDARLMDRFSIGDYLKGYEKKKKELLTSKLFISINNDYSKTTFATWEITIEEIKGNQEHGKLALEILDVVAYIGSENIPEKLFLSLAKNNESKLRSAIRLLIKYSIMDPLPGQRILSVHRLVQEVTRIKLLELGKSEEVIKRTFELLKEILPDDVNTSENYNNKSQLLEHFEYLLMGIGNWTIKEHENRKVIGRDYTIPLLKLMADKYSDLGCIGKQGEFLEEALPIFKEVHGSDSYEVAKLLLILGNVYRLLGNHEKQKKYLEEALAVFRTLQDDCYSIDIARILEELSIICESVDDYEKQKKYLEEALAVFRKLSDRNYDVEIAKVLVRLGSACVPLEGYGKQSEYLEEALAIFRKLSDRNYDVEIAAVLVKLGNAYMLLGNVRDQKQKEYFEEALAIFRKLHKLPNYEVAQLLVRLGNACMLLGDHENQKKHFEEALAAFRKLGCSAYNVEEAITLVNLGNTYALLGDHEKQKKYLEEALTVFRKLGDNADSVDTAVTLVRLGEACWHLSDYENQKKHLKEALTIFRTFQDEDYSVDIGRILIRLSSAFFGLEGYKKQKEYLEEALAVFRTLQDDYYSIDIARILEKLSMICENVGDHEKQKKYLEEALAVFRKLSDRNYDVEIAAVLVRLGNAYTLLGNVRDQKQKEYFEEALAIFRKLHKLPNYEVAELLVRLGTTCEDFGDYERQKECFEEAFTIFRELDDGDYSIKISEVLINPSDDCERLGGHKNQMIKLGNDRNQKRCFNSEACGHLDNFANKRICVEKASPITKLDDVFIEGNTMELIIGKR